MKIVHARVQKKSKTNAKTFQIGSPNFGSLNRPDLLKEISSCLLKWFKKNQRPLPWRVNSDPYRIWISEVMLQQTQVATVVPYYEKFLAAFPNIQALASASEEQVLANWAGLGYYSRARLLHRSAKVLAEKGFPKTYSELLELPGFGPYTSRAVSSLAFNEPVGVLDGNVIRVLTRIFALKIPWWNQVEKQYLQEISDSLAKVREPRLLNQSLMELGALVCTPQKPVCLVCPVRTYCESQKLGLTTQLPLPKPRRAREIWFWTAEVHQKQNQIGITKEHTLPFLKNHWVLPGSAVKMKKRPRTFDIKHSVTHHDIFVKVKSVKQKKPGLRWVQKERLPEIAPSSLLSKIMKSLTVFLLVTNFACSSKKVNEAKPAPAPKGQIQSSFETQNDGSLKISGPSSQSFFANNDELIFLREVSENPRQQIFSLNLKTMRESRMTYQLGTITHPSISTDGEFLVFSSTQDEGKDIQKLADGLIEKYVKGAPEKSTSKKAIANSITSPYEIYLLKSDKRELIRISKIAGADLSPSIFENQVYWLHQRDQNSTEFMRARPNSGGGGEIKFYTSGFYDFEMHMGYGQFVWVRNGVESPELFYSPLKPFVPTRLADPSVLPKGEYRTPRFVSDHEIVFSAKLNGQKVFDLYIYDLKSKKLNQIFADETDKLYPSLSPSGDKLSFTRKISDEKSEIVLFMTRTWTKR